MNGGGRWICSNSIERGGLWDMNPHCLTTDHERKLQRVQQPSGPNRSCPHALSRNFSEPKNVLTKIILESWRCLMRQKQFTGRHFSSEKNNDLDNNSLHPVVSVTKSGGLENWGRYFLIKYRSRSVGSENFKNLHSQTYQLVKNS